MKQEIKEIKTATITGKGQICIPQEARELAGFRTGEKVSIIVYNDRVEIRSLKKMNENLLSAILSEEVLGRAWNTKEEDEAWKDL